MSDLMEVCPLSGGMILNASFNASQPLSNSLQIGLRFFHLPLPAVPSASLAARFPLRMNIRRENYGLTTFRINTSSCNLGSTSPPGVRHLRQVS
jgi:hypothetical protein